LEDEACCSGNVVVNVDEFEVHPTNGSVFAIG
jgi:hypothetical protein